MKRILIAHQSAIPHYRVPFFEALHKMMPEGLHFVAVTDHRVGKQKHYQPLAPDAVSFETLETKTLMIPYGKKKRLLLQSWIAAIPQYDALIIEDAVNNLTYPIAHLAHFLGKPVMLWGHGRDVQNVNPRGIKGIAERFKGWQARHADGFFAYTTGVKEHLIQNGVRAKNIVVLNNTIDINEQRTIFARLRARRDHIRSEMGWSGKKVLLYVGRLSHGKKVPFLIHAFKHLHAMDPRYVLSIVGEGDRSTLKGLLEDTDKGAIQYWGPLYNEALGRICLASDVYAFPGDVGLGPVLALCYDLTPVVIESRTHKPEYEYLHDGNALILPEGTTPEAYAHAIKAFLSDAKRVETFRANAWPSIEHLTIDKMAENFLRGVLDVLGASQKA